LEYGVEVVVGGFLYIEAGGENGYFVAVGVGVGLAGAVERGEALAVDLLEILLRIG
jgi:hypothetical protein